MTLCQVLDELERRKLSVGALYVGTIRVVFAGPREIDPPRQMTEDERRRHELRRKSLKAFGRILPDDELEAMAGAL